MQQQLAPWRVTGSRISYEDRWLRIRTDQCETQDGRVIDAWHVLERGPWVNVLALTVDRQAVLVREYRHGIGEVALRSAMRVPWRRHSASCWKKQATAAANSMRSVAAIPMPPIKIIFSIPVSRSMCRRYMTSKISTRGNRLRLCCKTTRASRNWCGAVSYPHNRSM